MVSCDTLFFHCHNGKTYISHAQKMWDNATNTPNDLIAQQHQTDVQMGDKLLVSLLFIICFLQQQNSPKPLTHQSSCQSQITRKFVISHTRSPAAKLTSAINLPTIFSKPLHPPYRLPSPLPKNIREGDFGWHQCSCNRRNITGPTRSHR